MTNKNSIGELSKNNLTIEDIRSIPDFTNFSDEEIIVIVESIKELAMLLYKIQSEDMICKNKF